MPLYVCSPRPISQDRMPYTVYDSIVCGVNPPMVIVSPADFVVGAADFAAEFGPQPRFHAMRHPSFQHHNYPKVRRDAPHITL